MRRCRRTICAVVWGILSAAAVAASACASDPFHEHYEAGRYGEALAAFRADSSLRGEEKSLYRAGLLYARPRTPHYDPELAARYLGRLLKRYPDTSHAEEVRSVLALLEQTESLDRQARMLISQLVAGVGPETEGGGLGEAFHEHYEAGRYDEALAAFRADSTMRQNERALYRVGLLHARPGTPYYDPGLASRYLGRLVRNHPDTPYAEEVRSVLALLEQTRTLDRRARQLRSQLEALKAVDLGDSLPDTTRLPRLPR